MGWFSKKKKYELPYPENTACLTCSHVLEKKKPVLRVTRDADDGMWQFLCGGTGHSESTGRMVSLKEMVMQDQSLNGLHKMPTGVGADREEVGGPWKPFKL